MDFLNQLSASQKNLDNLAPHERLAFAPTKKRKSHIITTGERLLEEGAGALCSCCCCKIDQQSTYVIRAGYRCRRCRRGPVHGVQH